MARALGMDVDPEEQAHVEEILGSMKIIPTMVAGRGAMGCGDCFVGVMEGGGVILGLHFGSKQTEFLDKLSKNFDIFPVFFQPKRGRGGALIHVYHTCQILGTF